MFSLGLAIPFMLVAVVYSRASEAINRYGCISKWVSTIGGVFLIMIGILLLTEQFGLTVKYGYTFFHWLGLEFLFDHL